jgi:hypothetical protein
MTSLAKSPMLDLLQTLAAYPEWESAEWIDAVKTAIREAIKEVERTNKDVATLLASFETASVPADRERALNAALEEWEAKTEATSAIRPQSIRERLGLASYATESLSDSPELIANR